MEPLRHRALMLSDVATAIGAVEVSASFPDGVTLCVGEDGCHVLPVDGEPIDLTAFVDDTGLVVA